MRRRRCPAPPSTSARRLSCAYRIARALLLSAIAIAGIVACGQPGDSSLPPIDLIRELPRAERRATAPIAEAVRVELVSVAGDIQPALVMVAPARLTYSVRMPARATL